MYIDNLVYKYFKLKYNNTNNKILLNILINYPINYNIQPISFPFKYSFTDLYFLMHYNESNKFKIEDANDIEIKQVGIDSIDRCFYKKEGKSNFLCFVDKDYGKLWGVYPKSLLLNLSKDLDL